MYITFCYWLPDFKGKLAASGRASNEFPENLVSNVKAEFKAAIDRNLFLGTRTASCLT